MDAWVHGIGIDTTTVTRIRAALTRTPSVLDRLFTREEQADALARGEAGSDPHITYLAGAFAIKEAVAKSFGTGFGEMRWTEVKTTRTPNGKPEVHLAGVATTLATRFEIGAIHVSLTTEGDQVTAMALAERAIVPQSGGHDG